MQAGERIGDYTIVQKIGEGGMSVVYLAEHADDRAQVVVKELKEQYRFDPQLVDRFLRGAEILQELRHPHLALVYACLEHGGKRVMVEEYLSGGSLADLLDRGAPYSEEEALCWCRDALHALDYAHEHGIVHRDVKPNNLMLDGQRRIKVIDFGIARVFGETRFTRTGDAAPGTLEYMSPEQVLAPDQVMHLTDVYSMGIVLYELLTGSVPFSGKTPFEIQEKVTRQTPAPIKRFRRNLVPMNPQRAGIDPALAKIVMRAIEKRPERRFGGCGEFALHVDRLLAARRAPGWSKRWLKAWRHVAFGFRMPSRRGVIAGAALAALLLVLWGVNAAWPGRVNVSPPPVALPSVAGAPAPLPIETPRPIETRRPIETPPPAEKPRPIEMPRPGIRLVREAIPDEVRAAGTVVTYKYVVTNSGNVALKNPKVTDDAAAPRLRDGDSNGNLILDVGETWTYEAAVTVGQARLDAGSGLDSTAYASADDVTSPPVKTTVALSRRPGIDVKTLVSPAELKAPGRATFTYTVTNTGNVSLTNVRVTDRHNARPMLTDGDSNMNHVLDVGEVWRYSCGVAIRARPNPFVSRAVAMSDQVTSDPAAVTVAIASKRPAREPANDAPLQPADAAAESAAAPLESPAPAQSVAPWSSRPTKEVRGVFPPAAIKAGLKVGTVLVDITVGRDGRVQDAKVRSSSSPLFDQAALDAVRQWEFAPTSGGPEHAQGLIKFGDP